MRRPKWLAKPLSAALIEPFLMSLNKQPTQIYKFSLADIEHVLVGASAGSHALPRRAHLGRTQEATDAHLSRRTHLGHACRRHEHTHRGTLPSPVRPRLIPS